MHPFGDNLSVCVHFWMLEQMWQQKMFDKGGGKIELLIGIEKGGLRLTEKGVIWWKQITISPFCLYGKIIGFLSYSK